MTTIAKYGGRCELCDGAILPGDELEHDAVEDEWVHAECRAEAEVEDEF